jgi:hypothetical protein
MNREPIKIIGDILKNFMSLTDDQIWIYNQDFKIPETRGLFVLLQYNNSKNYSSTNTFIPAAEGVEVGQQSITSLMKEDYTINVISKNDEARQRKEEVILALSSNFSQDKQGEFQFQIARITNSFVNVSELEGAGMLNRFALNISLLAHYNKTIDTVYYDNFTNQIEID